MVRQMTMYSCGATIEKRYEDALAAVDDSQQAEEINISIMDARM